MRSARLYVNALQPSHPSHSPSPRDPSTTQNNRAGLRAPSDDPNDDLSVIFGAPGSLPQWTQLDNCCPGPVVQPTLNYAPATASGFSTASNSSS